MSDVSDIEEERPKNNPYTEDDKVLLSKMRKIDKEPNEVSDKISFTFCPREMWGALPPRSEPPMRPMKFPAEYVRFSDTGTDECYTPYECFKVLQHLQKEHMEKESLPDIKYNFMVGADGTIYEGRGWKNDADRPPDVPYLEGKCIDIAFIGNITDQEQNDPIDPFPRVKCEYVGFQWMFYGQQHKYIKEDCAVFPLLRDYKGIPEDPEKIDPDYLRKRKAALDWVVHGQQGNNYVARGFFLIQS